MSTFKQLMMRRKQTSDDYLAFTAEEAASTISLSVTGTPTYNLKYSTNKIGWYTFADSTANIINIITLNNIGDTVYIKGTYENLSGYITFIISKKTSVSGNLYSILDKDNFETIIDLTNYSNTTFNNLFYNCTKLTNARNLRLPATTLSYNCYNQMFYGCDNLVSTPFLPATTLAKYCYRMMFLGCTSLINVSDLPAIVLTENCYDSMFVACTSLVKGPYIMANVLAENCFNEMFRYSTLLNEIKINYTGNFIIDYFHDWVYNVASVGTFYYNGTDTSNFDDSAIPIGWTIQTFS